MICFVKKRSRRINGVLHTSEHYYGILKMPWEPKETTWSLGTTDKREAERLLHEERVRREKERNGVLPPRPQQKAAEKPLNELLEKFLADLQVIGRAEGTLKKYRNLLVVFRRCGWDKIGDVTPRSFCDYRAHIGLGPRTLNAALKDTGTFFRWLRRQRMASENPLELVPTVDTRRVEKYRRALTAEETRKLIANAPKNRAVIYLLAVCTGLRRTELEQLTIGDFQLDSAAPFVRVRAGTAKHPKDSQLRLRPELVEALQSLVPAGAKPSERMFPSVPRVRTFMKDLAAAGIPFEDDKGRRADFHALRDTFGTQLASAGVAPFVLKELMRHSTVQQSEKYYIDARHLPLAAAVSSLPNFTTPVENNGTVNGTVTQVADRQNEPQAVAPGREGRISQTL